ncbi:T9SS C-terminal target domain-containing protein [Leeuwenhoekiella sp. A16]|uniref:T9SS C-terminal target domain-containing protein n=1 Tax=Leeuwenhoekiella sp. A16 TaxID=3141462 RepID=UPI003A7F874F
MRYFFIIFVLCSASMFGQASGCTDSLASNYDASAKENDGSCIYAEVIAKPETFVTLPKSVNETSGLIAFNGHLLTHNDGNDSHLYELDTLTGAISHTYTLNGFKNVDWEDITQDDNYIYLGDFGNNYTGIRKDLKILKISKTSLLKDDPEVEVINFKYPDQEAFAKAAPNTTDFDCEAFVIKDEKIYLFTKQWTKTGTAIYELPILPGSYTAAFKTTFPINGLVTGATYVKAKNILLLCGYSKSLEPFIYICSQFKNNVFSGNKRKIKLALPFHQVEGITSLDGKRIYVSNESLVKKPFANIPAQMHVFDLKNWINY